MAWDSSRPVPWRRLIREWLVYVVIAGIAIVIYYIAKGDGVNLGVLAGLLSSGPIYVLFGGFLAKFGYQRKTLKQLREERVLTTPVRSERDASAAPAMRNRPAPTRRTSTGPPQHRKSTKPKRR